MKNKRIILASSSPRRKALIEGLGINFYVCPTGIEEDIHEGENPREHALRLARDKARKARDRCHTRNEHDLMGCFFIGADTIVILDGRIMGKPADEEDAERMLRALGGRTHSVITAFSIIEGSTCEEISEVVESLVTMKELTTDEIKDYVATGEPMDKAGSYAVQGIGSSLVEKVEGSYTNVVGLPIEELDTALKSFDLVPGPCLR